MSSIVVAITNGDSIVGVKAPAIMLLAFVPMFFIAIAYSELNKAEPDCGTTFTWASRAFGPCVGWLGGPPRCARPSPGRHGP